MDMQFQAKQAEKDKEFQASEAEKNRSSEKDLSNNSSSGTISVDEIDIDNISVEELLNYLKTLSEEQLQMLIQKQPEIGQFIQIINQIGGQSQEENPQGGVK